MASDGVERGKRMVDVARGYVGTRWRHQGRAPGDRLDCAGVIVCAGREVGVDVIDARGYSTNPVAQLQPTLEKNCVRVPFEEVREGDILLFSWQGERVHVGIFSGYRWGEPYFIHGYAGARQVSEMRLDDSWRGSLALVYRFKDFC